MEDRIIYAGELAEMIGVTASTIWRQCQSGNIPAPFAVGGTRRRGWRLTTINAWMAACEAATPAEVSEARERSRAQRQAG